MRELNRLSILNCVRLCGPIARVALAQRTGLSRTTVSSVMEELLTEGLVREGELLDAAPSGGRRATPVHFNGSAGYVLGVDLGRTHFIALITNLSAEVIARRSGPLNSELGPDVCLPQVIAELRSLVQSTGIPWARIFGVGIGIPGPFDGKLGTLINPPAMPGWDGFNIGSLLQRELEVAIYVDNDANMGAVGESRFGVGRGVADMAYVKIATGIGCGLIINGQIYRGSHGSAGELGHVTINEEGALCDCGNRGCLETVASAAAITRDAMALIPQASPGDPLGRPVSEAEGIAPGERLLGSNDIRHDIRSEETPVDIADVVRAALNGDRSACTAIQRAGNHIGVALAGLVNVMNPSLILIDGSVARAGELLLEPIRRVIAARSLKAASTSTSVVLGELGDNAIALGAVASVIDATFNSTSALAIQARERVDADIALIARA
jgi:predicted NBD/HSP70 family sugar kinase